VIDTSKVKPEGLYTMKEISEILNVPVNTIRYWVYAGKLNKKKIGRRVHVKGQDIIALLEGEDDRRNKNS